MKHFGVRSFLCRQRLGYRADKQAEYLTPVPSESVVYGSGETAVVLSKVFGPTDCLLLHFIDGTPVALALAVCFSKLKYTQRLHLHPAFGVPEVVCLSF